MKLPERKRALPVLNLSPLIDVIFILLIFVVLVARFVDQERIDVTLPSAEAGRPAELEALEISMTAEGDVWVDGQQIARDAMFDAFTVHRRGFQRAVLIADQEAKLQDAVEVISSAKLAGFEAVSLATRPPDP